MYRGATGTHALGKSKSKNYSPPTKEVDNPNYEPAHHGAKGNPKHIVVAYNPRESYAGYLHYRGKISEAEWRAASRVRQAFEAMGASIQGIDTTKEPVDGGRIGQTITEHQLVAGQTLREARNAQS